mmetsp:Transcript_15128/g.28160  ORF Transcript_15128/g.28160 Transcript_15128/m.28160 type:complete len:341 (-) Transcript_15128:1673-2695(-)
MCASRSFTPSLFLAIFMKAETSLDAAGLLPLMLLRTTPASLLLTTSQLATRSRAMASRGPLVKALLDLSRLLTYLVRHVRSLESSVKATALRVELAAFLSPLAQMLLTSLTDSQAAFWTVALKMANSLVVSSSQASPSALSSRASVQSSTRWSLMLTMALAWSPASASFSSSAPATSPMRSSLASSVILLSSPACRVVTFHARMTRLSSSLTTTLDSSRVWFESLHFSILFSAHSLMVVTNSSTSPSKNLSKMSTLLARILNWVKARPRANSESASTSPFFFFLPLLSLKAARSLILPFKVSTMDIICLLASTALAWEPPAMWARLMAHWVRTASSVLLT